MAEPRYNLRQRQNERAATAELEAPRRTADSSVSNVGEQRTFPPDSLVEAIPSPAMVIDGQRRIEAVNQRFCDSFGLKSPYLYAGEPFAEFARRLEET